MYEAYKPKTYEEAKEYIGFILDKRYILPNELEDSDAEPSNEANASREDFDFTRPAPLPERAFSPNLLAFITEDANRRQGFALY